MTTAASVPILFIGDAQREEFRAAARSLVDRGAVIAADVSRAQAIISQGFAPAMIVVAQSWPNQFSERRIEELRRASPLARIVRLLGTWMDGDGRTGKPWPATMLASWQRWDARHSDMLPGLSLPITASEDDRLLAAGDAAHSIPSAQRDSLWIAVHAQSRDTAESLIELCSQRGWNALWLRNVNAALPSIVDCAVFDARDTSAKEIQDLVNLRTSLGAAPIIALVGFPRLEDVERFQAAGASAIVSKPFLADDLARQIERFVGQPAVR